MKMVVRAMVVGGGVVAVIYTCKRNIKLTKIIIMQQSIIIIILTKDKGIKSIHQLTWGHDGPNDPIAYSGWNNFH